MVNSKKNVVMPDELSEDAACDLSNYEDQPCNAEAVTPIIVSITKFLIVIGSPHLFVT